MLLIDSDIFEDGSYAVSKPENIGIVSTSINEEPLALDYWTNQGHLILAGDQNVPISLKKWIYEKDGITYLETGYRFPGFQYIPLNCIQRRNAAIWYAISIGYEYILTVDDDNYPGSLYHASAMASIIGRKSHELTESLESRFLNLGTICQPTYHQRGTPYGLDTESLFLNVISEENPHAPEIVVVQSMVLGDPDCDAVERMVNAPEVASVEKSIVVSPGTYAAFNSQSTMWAWKWAPVMAVMPDVGRYDDIFASLIFHRMAETYNVALYAGHPTVKQIRNEHNLINDLKAEYFGMRNVIKFVDLLSEAHINSEMPLWMAYSELIASVASILPTSAVKFANEWVAGWRDHVG